MALAICFVFSSITVSNAALTGQISGTVVDATSKQPLANVAIVAVSPSGRASAKTDAKGFFSLTGVQPDSYTLSATLEGYETSVTPGVNVAADQTQNVAITLGKKLREIGRISSTSASSAYQGRATTDTYTINQAQIIATQGKDNNNNEVQLVTAQPGVSIDASGYPSIRGGREFEVGLTYEGINYADAYANQFTNSYVTTGVGQLQVTPGAGPITQNPAGAGVVNTVAKRGTYPAFGQISGEIGSQTFWHDLILEYGFATPDGHLSNYFSFTGQRQGPLYPARNSLVGPQSLTTNSNGFNYVNDYVDNFIYKFGKDQTQSVQLFYEGQYVLYNIGGTFGTGPVCNHNGNPADCLQLTYPNGNNPLIQRYLGLNADNALFTGAGGNPIGYANFGLPTNQQYSNLLAWYNTQPAQNATITGVTSQNQPNQAFKIQYNNNINSSTYFNVAYKRDASTGEFNYPYYGGSTSGSNNVLVPFYAQQGGFTTAFTADVVKQVNEANLVQFGGNYNIVQPVWVNNSMFNGLSALNGYGSGYEVGDFLPTNPDTCNVADLNGNTYCGYLSNYFRNGPGTTPALTQYNPGYLRHEFGIYANDQFTYKRLRLSAGLRWDAGSVNFGDLVAQGYANENPNNKVTNPSFFNPKIAASYEIGSRDSVRASYGRSIEFAPFSYQLFTVARSDFNRFNGVPSQDTLGLVTAINTDLLNGGAGTGFKPGPATFCGLNFNQTCKSYADQLYWEDQHYIGQPIQPLQPESFTNWDFSYSHQFPNQIALRVTPFYRRGYNAFVISNPIIGHQPDGANILGPAVASNDGVNKTTGLEFYLTKDSPTGYGFSGSWSGTYLNEFSNVVPLTNGEDFVTSIPPASIGLGKLYRVGFESPFESTLALQYKTRVGFTIRPVITYVRGFPYNSAGLLGATTINGKNVIAPVTNANVQQATSGATQFVDPANPGSILSPKIAATTGTAESNDPGGLISNARFNTQLTLEYSPPKNQRLTLGVQFYGLFNSIYGYPTLNPLYQPVATGVSGPASGQVSSTAYPYQKYGVVSSYGNSTTGVNIGGTQPYLLTPTNALTFTAATPQTPFFSLFYLQYRL